MKRLIVLAMALGVLVSALQAFSADWKFFGTDSTGGKSYVDFSTITYSNKDVVRFWVKRVYTDKGVEEVVKRQGNRFESLADDLMLWEVNCFEKKCRQLHVTGYSKSGVVIDSWNGVGEWTFIIPESTMESLSKFVCKGK